MARHQIQAPDGSIHEIEAPDNANPEQITQFFAQNFTPEIASGKTSLQNSFDTKKGFFDSVGDKLQESGASVADAMNAEALGQQGKFQTTAQILGKGIAKPINDIVGEGISALTPEFVKEGLVKIGQVAATPFNALNKVINPNAPTLGEATQNIAAGYGDFAAKNPNAARTIESVANIASLIPIGKGAKLAGNVTGDVAQGAINKTANALAPNITEATAQLAKRAGEFGIPLRIDQIDPTRVKKTIQKLSQDLPLSGNEGFEQIQSAAVQKALAKTIGQNADNLSPDVIKNYLKDANQKFGVIVGDEPIKFQNFDRLDDIRQEANLLSNDAADIIEKNLKDFELNLSNGEINGKKLASYRTRLTNRISKLPGDAQQPLNELLDFIDGTTELNLGEEAAKTLSQARREYRNFKTIEPLLEKSPDGNINPIELINRVKASPYIKASRQSVGEDDLVDLARISKEFLPKVGGSDTATKLAYLTGGAGIASLATNPVIAAKIGAGLTGNRAYQKLYNTSQGLVKRAINKADLQKAFEAKKKP